MEVVPDSSRTKSVSFCDVWSVLAESPLSCCSAVSPRLSLALSDSGGRKCACFARNQIEGITSIFFKLDRVTGRTSMVPFRFTSLQKTKKIKESR